MQRNQASITAEGIAAMRAIETERPADVRICNDPYARRLVRPWVYWVSRLFLNYGERRGPGVAGFLVARTRYIDDTLLACLRDGIEQLVLLGAGLDSRAYRFPELARQVRVFEVDHPATQPGKIARVRRIFAGLPEHVAYVAVDFNTQSLAERLSLSGYREDVKTLFIWEGVVHYLAPDGVDATLGFIRGHSGTDSRVIFDYVYKDALTPGSDRRGEVVRMQRYRRFTGEGLVFGIERGTIRSFLEQRGFTAVVDATAQDLRRLYFHGANSGRAIAEIYAIAHARVG